MPLPEYRGRRLPWILGSAFLAIRTVLHGILALTERFQPETSMAVILDVPTMVIYLMVAIVGHPWPIHGFADIRFFLLGGAVWLASGVVLGFGIRRRQNRHF